MQLADVQARQRAWHTRRRRLHPRADVPVQVLTGGPGGGRGPRRPGAAATRRTARTRRAGCPADLRGQALRGGDVRPQRRRLRPGDLGRVGLPRHLVLDPLPNAIDDELEVDDRPLRAHGLGIAAGRRADARETFGPGRASERRAGAPPRYPVPRVPYVAFALAILISGCGSGASRDPSARARPCRPSRRPARRSLPPSRLAGSDGEARPDRPQPRQVGAGRRRHVPAHAAVRLLLQLRQWRSRPGARR